MSHPLSKEQLNNLTTQRLKKVLNVARTYVRCAEKFPHAYDMDTWKNYFENIKVILDTREHLE